MSVHHCTIQWMWSDTYDVACSSPEDQQGTFEQQPYDAHNAAIVWATPDGSLALGDLPAGGGGYMGGSGLQCRGSLNVRQILARHPTAAMLQAGHAAPTIGLWHCDQQVVRWLHLTVGPGFERSAVNAILIWRN